MAGAALSDNGVVEVGIAGGCAAAIIVSWIIAIILIFFPRHDTDTYRRRLVANMPRARDETLPPELQLQSTIDSISQTNAATTATSGQSQNDTVTTKDEEAKIQQQQDEPFEDGGSLKNSTKDETKDQKPAEMKSKPEKSVPKTDQKLGKKKGAAADEKKPERSVEKKQEKAAEKKSGKDAEKKDDKKEKEEKPKEKDKKKK